MDEWHSEWKNKALLEMEDLIRHGKINLPDGYYLPSMPDREKPVKGKRIKTLIIDDVPKRKTNEELIQEILDIT